MKRTVKAVVLDWAGTAVDFGSRAPARVFQAIFEDRGVPISEAQARGPMGKAKWDHIRAVADDPEVAARWLQKYGQPVSDADVDELYARFLPLQKQVLGQHCDLIPGMKPVFDELVRRGIAVGSSTGYTRELMEVVTAAAAEQGYTPAAVICSDDVPAGRPAPWMMLEALSRLGVYPAWQTIKVDDTPVGIEAGRNAGAWTVAVIRSGNELGLSAEEVAAADQVELRRRLDIIEEKFRGIGADFVINDVSGLPEVIDIVNDLLASGEFPSIFDK